MELVVDTNILFSYFWKKTLTRKMLTYIEPISPNFAITEILKYREEIIRKTKIKNFDEELKLLKTHIEFVKLDAYHSFLSKAKKISPDPNDIDFFALALLLKIAIWSNDKDLKLQKGVMVFSTNDLIMANLL